MGGAWQGRREVSFLSTSFGGSANFWWWFGSEEVKIFESLPHLGTHPLHHLEEKDILPRAQGKQMPSIGYSILKILDKKKSKKNNNFEILGEVLRGGPSSPTGIGTHPMTIFRLQFGIFTIGLNLSLDCVYQGKSLYIATMQMTYFTTTHRHVINISILYYRQL